MKKLALSISGLLLFSYLGVCVYFYNIQNSILFNPTLLEEGHQFSYSFNFEERWFDIEEEVRIHSIHAKADSSRGLVLFFHGNAGSTDTDSLKFLMFLEEGYDVLYPDYREFGLSIGKLWTQDEMVGDMLSVYNEMADEYGEENIIVLGYSMGSGVAAQVAAANDPREVVIWTPYYSIVDEKNANYSFLPDFLVRFPLRTDLAIQEIEEPITIFYAEEDERLPVERSIRLTQFLDENDEYIMLPNQGHNWVYRNELLQQKMKEILNRG